MKIILAYYPSKDPQNDYSKKFKADEDDYRYPLRDDAKGLPIETIVSLYTPYDKVNIEVASGQPRLEDEENHLLIPVTPNSSMEADSETFHNFITKNWAKGVDVQKWTKYDFERFQKNK